MTLCLLDALSNGLNRFVHRPRTKDFRTTTKFCKDGNDLLPLRINRVLEKPTFTHPISSLFLAMSRWRLNNYTFYALTITVSLIHDFLKLILNKKENSALMSFIILSISSSQTYSSLSFTIVAPIYCEVHNCMIVPNPSCQSHL